MARHFDYCLVIDANGEPVTDATGGKVFGHADDVAGTELAITDWFGTPVVELASSKNGSTPPFKIASDTYDVVYVRFGDVTTGVISLEGQNGAAAAAEAAASRLAAESAAADAAKVTDNLGQSISDAIAADEPLRESLKGVDGEDGTNGVNGAGPLRLQFDGLPAIGSTTWPFQFPRPVVVDKFLRAWLKSSNNSTTPCTVALAINGVEVPGSAVSILQGQGSATLNMAADVVVPALANIQAFVKNMGTSSGTGTTAPIPRTGAGIYSSGNNGAPITTTSATAVMPISWSPGDRFRVKVVATDQPSTPAGWDKVGATVSDSVPQVYMATYSRVAVAGDTAPTFTFPANAGVIVAMIAVPGVDGSSPLDKNDTTGSTALANSIASKTVTTDATTTNESAFVAYATRFNAGVTPVNVTTDAALTEMLDVVTNRGTAAGAPANLGLVWAYKTLSAAATVVPPYTASLPGGVTSRWVTSVETLRPGSASSAGDSPTLDVLVTYQPTPPTP